MILHPRVALPLNALLDADVHLGSTSTHLTGHLDGGLGEVHALTELIRTLASLLDCTVESRLVLRTAHTGAVGS